jgi:capsular exopolysaccharide synthesis family protein
MDNPPVEAKGAAYHEAHLRDYWKIVWQARWTIAAIFFVVVGITAVWTYTQTPVYRATATVEIQPQANRVAAGRDISGLGVSGYGWFAEEKYHNTQVEIIRSFTLAERVYDKLHLKDHDSFVNLSRNDGINAFRGRIMAVPRRETGLIEISIVGTNANDITQWVNQVAEAFEAYNLERATNNVKKALTTIQTQMKNLQQEVSDAEVARFEALKLSTLSSEEQAGIIKERLQDYNSELNRTQIEMNRLREKLDRIRELRTSGADVMSIPELADDVNLRDMYAERVKLERALEAAKVEYRPGHQIYQKTEGELEKVQQRIRERVSVIVGTLQNRYDLAAELEEYLKEEIRQAEDLSVQVAQGRSDYELKKTQAENKKHIYDLIAQTVNEVQIGEQLMNNNVTILDRATVPPYPIKPRKRLNLMIGAMFGLFLGVGAAFFLDYLDNTFRTPDDVEKYLSLSVLGVIPKLREEDSVNDRAIKEAYQSLRTSVIFSSKNHRRKVILVTSSGPQEGKSSTINNLGRMLAAAGDSVILVDCDLRRPVQHQIQDSDRDFGLTNYLAAPIEAQGAEADWTTYVKPVGPQNLHVMTSGPIPPSPPELLGSDRFSKLVARLRDSYDWVLIDSPPAASLADATVLASLVDMVVLVVRHARTDRDVVSKTLSRLRAVNPTVVGAVLNAVDLERAYHKDYYYAGAYYYSEDGERRSARKRRVESKANVG